MNLEERRYQLLVEGIAEHAIFMLDPAGFIVTWNAGAAKLLGYTAAEIVGEHISHLFSDEDRSLHVPDDVLSQARGTGHYEGERSQVRKDRNRVWAALTIDAIQGDADAQIGFAVVTRAIQGRPRGLRDHEHQFRLLIDSVRDYAIYMLDPSGVVASWNAGAARIKGYSAHEIIGQHFSRFFTDEERRAGMPTRILEIAARDGRHELEGWRVRKTGELFWAAVVVDAVRDDTGQLIGFTKITRDITERRAAEQALANSERQFRLLVAGVIDYGLYMLDLNGLITSWNTGAAKIKGYSADEVIGQHYSIFFTESDRSAGLPARALYMATQHGRYESEGWRVRKDGTLFYVSAAVDAIRDEQGTLIGFAKITRDITERREAQLALQRAQEHLAHAQKMEALGKLTGGVAHDFNNLLMVVSGHANILKRIAPADNPRFTKSLDAIVSVAKTGEKLTRQMLSFSRRHPLNPEMVALGDQIAQFQTVLSSSITGNINLVVAVPEDVWPIKVDVSELELALLNITINARDAMPEGGTISLSAENVTLAHPNTVEGLSGDFVALALADTGDGIPADILPNIFDPFFTTKQVDKGTGLGLSQVYGFAAQSGGTVRVTSEIGQGTRLTLYIPRARIEGTGAAVENDGDDDTAALGHIKVLLVEDNPEVSAITQALLEQLDYQVHTVGSADMALALLDGGARFDIVFTDIVMAGKTDGLGLARFIRERYPELPVLLATGYSKSSEIAESEFMVLRKPYQISEFQTAARELLRPRLQADGSNLVSFAEIKRRQREA